MFDSFKFHKHSDRELLLVILRELHEIKETLKNMADAQAQALADLQAQVEAQTTTELSAITLLNGLGSQIANLQPDDSAQIEAFKASFEQSRAALAVAVTANTTPTPASPAPVSSSNGDTNVAANTAESSGLTGDHQITK